MTGTGPVLCPGNRERWRNGTHAPRSPAPPHPGAAGAGAPCRGPVRSGAGHCELYSPGALFSWPELQAMAADGVLTQLYQRGYLPPGTQPARSCAPAPRPWRWRRRSGSGWWLGRMTAAWIYGCAARAGPPGAAGGRQPADLQSAGPLRGCTFHEVRLGPFDVVSMGGLMVSSPLRTALDVALHVDAERAVPALAALLARPSWASGCGSLRLAVEAEPARSAQEGGPGEARRPAAEPAAPDDPARKPGPSLNCRVSCGGGSRWCGRRRRRRRSGGRR